MRVVQADTLRRRVGWMDWGCACRDLPEDSDAGSARAGTGRRVVPVRHVGGNRGAANWPTETVGLRIAMWGEDGSCAGQ